jgi:hypothetical protein
MTVATGKMGYPPVVVMMLPWEGEIGQLETICLISMRDKFPNLAACEDQFSACTGTDKWKRNKLEKMKMRAMLTTACEEDPNTSLTHAWSRKNELIPLDHACFNRIADFLAQFPAMVSPP